MSNKHTFKDNDGDFVVIEILERISGGDHVLFIEQTPFLGGTKKIAIALDKEKMESMFGVFFVKTWYFVTYNQDGTLYDIREVNDNSYLSPYCETKRFERVELTSLEFEAFKKNAAKNPKAFEDSTNA